MRFQPPDQDEAVTTLGHSLADGIRSLGFSLGADDVCLPLLLGLFYDEARALGFLLCDLLLFNGLGELFAESHVRNGDILEGNVELVGALEQVGADAVRDGFSLSDELCGVELGDDGFEDFVADGGEDSLIVVEAEVLQPVNIYALCASPLLQIGFLRTW